MRFFERKGLSAIGLSFSRAGLSDLFLGSLFGAMPIVLYITAAVTIGYGEIEYVGLSLAVLPGIIGPVFLTIFLLSAWEELAFRGYLLRQFSLGSNDLAAVIITGVLFGLLHSGNPGANWQGLVYTAFGGVLMGWLMIRSGSLWLLIGYHFGWNAAASPLFGLELSGTSQPNTLFQTTLNSADWLTGGTYGFEAAFPTVVAEVFVLSIVISRINRAGRAG